MSNRIFSRIFIVFIMAVLPMAQAAAQDWKSLLSGVASKVGEKVTEKVAEKIDTIMVAGQWVYVQPDCQFESEDLLSKAGGDFASSTIENQMSNVLSKLGVNETTVFTLSPDSTYSVTLRGHTMKGTYSVNKATKEITLTSRLRMSFTAQIKKNIIAPDKMSLLFRADKLMSFIQNITGNLAKKSSNKSISAANAILSKFDGLMLGIELKNNKSTIPVSGK